MFILELSIYIIFTVIMVNLGKKSNRVSQYIKSSRWDIYLKCYIIFFTIICAIRYGVGGDSIAYAHMFKYGIPTNTLEDRSNEFIWIWFVDCFQKYNIHYTFGMGLIAFLQLFFLIKGTKEFKYLLVSIPIVLFSGRFYLELMNGMRQMLIACLFFYISRWIIERKFFYYIATLWIAHYIHNSALMLIPLYFIPTKISLANKKNTCLVIFFICLFIGQLSFFKSLTGYITEYANLMGYEDYVETITTKLNDKNAAETMSFGITMISYAIMSFIVIVFSNKLKERYENENKFFNIWYNYSFYFSCGFFLFCNVSHIFLRPFLYFELYLMIMLALIINYCQEGRRNKPLVKQFSPKQVYTFLIIVLWSGLAWSIFKVVSTNEWETITYKTILNNSI